jgi:heme-degrading monooxygenase HmoA
MGKVIRMSERVIQPAQEIKARDIMAKYTHEIRTQPGMLSMETLVDTSDSTRVIVVTEWESRKHMKFWLKSDLCKKVVSELDQVLDKPVSYRELMHHEGTLVKRIGAWAQAQLAQVG